MSADLVRNTYIPRGLRCLRVQDVFNAWLVRQGVRPSCMVALTIENQPWARPLSQSMDLYMTNEPDADGSMLYAHAPVEEPTSTLDVGRHLGYFHPMMMDELSARSHQPDHKRFGVGFVETTTRTYIWNEVITPEDLPLIEGWLRWRRDAVERSLRQLDPTYTVQATVVRDDYTVMLSCG